MKELPIEDGPDNPHIVTGKLFKTFGRLKMFKSYYGPQGVKTEFMPDFNKTVWAWCNIELNLGLFKDFVAQRKAAKCKTANSQ